MPLYSDQPFKLHVPVQQYLQSCTEQSLGMVIVKYQEMPSLLVINRNQTLARYEQFKFLFINLGGAALNKL